MQPNLSCAETASTGVVVPRLLITVGEPAGIGPDICVALRPEAYDASITLAGDPVVLAARARMLGVNFKPRLLAPGQQPVAGRLNLYPCNVRNPVQPGQLDAANAQGVLDSLDWATRACLQGQFDALVTGPVHKGVINDAGYAFTGHTEFIAGISGGYPVMMLATPALRVALATTHLPLREVADAITVDRLQQVIEVLQRDFRQRMGISVPRIGVCGLNPHAGEGGHLGDEELRIMIPVLERLRAQGCVLLGPMPADTIFVPDSLSQLDVVLAMYHDQGLPVLKAMGFGGAVNITLGLPVIRTSVDHGTAIDKAGKGTAQGSSLDAAILAALEMSSVPGAVK